MSKVLKITIEMGLHIGLANADQNDEIEVEIDAEEYNSMTDREREDWVQKIAEEWAWGYIDYWGEITAEEEVGDDE